MTAFELLDAMGGIEERWLCESYDRARARRIHLTRITAAAASLLLVSGIGIGTALTRIYDKGDAEAAPEFEYFGMTETAAAGNTSGRTGETEAAADTTASDLPTLLFRSGSGGMGFEGIMARELSEITGTNPWLAEWELTSLPVWYNCSAPQQYGLPEKPYTGEEMLEIAREIAGKLGEEILTHEVGTMQMYTPDGMTEYDSSVTAETSLYEITVMRGGMVSVLSENDPIGKITDKESALLLYERFSSLLEFENPEAEVIASYTYDGEPLYEIYLWDNAGDETGRILNYADKILLSSSDTWYGINFTNAYNRREYLGDYPIISLEEAVNMLLDGYYITTVPKALYGAPESVDHAELVYRTNDLYVMPYYKFRVPLEEDTDKHFDGEYAWGAYYVPAVSREYLDESTFWDGRFN